MKFYSIILSTILMTSTSYSADHQEVHNSPQHLVGYVVNINSYNSPIIKILEEIKADPDPIKEKQALKKLTDMCREEQESSMGLTDDDIGKKYEQWPSVFALNVIKDHNYSRDFREAITRTFFSLLNEVDDCYKSVFFDLIESDILKNENFIKEMGEETYLSFFEEIEKESSYMDAISIGFSLTVENENLSTLTRILFDIIKDFPICKIKYKTLLDIINETSYTDFNRYYHHEAIESLKNDLKLYKREYIIDMYNTLNVDEYISKIEKIKSFVGTLEKHIKRKYDVIEDRKRRMKKEKTEFLQKKGFKPYNLPLKKWSGR